MSRAMLPWHVETRGGLTVWCDLACRTCDLCQSGLPGRCETPLEPADVVGDRVLEVQWGHGDVGLIEAAAVAMDLVLAGSASGPAVLLLGSGSRLGEVGRALDAAGVWPLVLLGDVPAGTTLRVAAEGDVRSAFGHLRPSRRPDAVLTLDGDLATASRLVRRGGSIGSIGPVSRQPGFAAIVQRELTVLAPRDPSAAVRLLRHDRTRDVETVR